MKNIYDNGYWLLGRVEDIINYDKWVLASDEEEDFTEIINELKEYYDKDSIVCINYENGMGCVIEEFRKDSVLK